MVRITGHQLEKLLDQVFLFSLSIVHIWPKPAENNGVCSWGAASSVASGAQWFKKASSFVHFPWFSPIMH